MTTPPEHHEPHQAVSTPSRGEQLRQALQFLGVALQVACSDYDPHAPDHGRSSVQNALIGVLEFLAVLAPHQATLPAPLQDLLLGLVDLNHGTVIPLLQPAEKRGRAPKPIGDDLFRAVAAAAMTHLMTDPGIDRELAARDIAVQLNKMGHKPTLTAKEIMKWRERIMAGDPLGNLALQRYQIALRQVKGAEPKRGAADLLANLPPMHLGNFPRK